MNWKAIDSQALRNLAKDRFGEARKREDITDEERGTYDRCYKHKMKGKRNVKPT